MLITDLDLFAINVNRNQISNSNMPEFPKLKHFPSVGSAVVTVVCSSCFPDVKMMLMPIFDTEVTSTGYLRAVQFYLCSLSG